MNSVLKYIYNKGRTKLLIHRIDPSKPSGEYWVANSVFAVVADYTDLVQLGILNYSGGVVDARDREQSATLQNISEICFNNRYRQVCVDTNVILVMNDGKYTHIYNNGEDLIGVNDEFIQEVQKYGKSQRKDIEFYTLKIGSNSPILLYGNSIDYPLGLIMPLRFDKDVVSYLDGLRINGEFPVIPEPMRTFKRKVIRDFANNFHKGEILEIKTGYKEGWLVNNVAILSPSIVEENTTADLRSGLSYTFLKAKHSVLRSNQGAEILDECEDDDLPF